MPPKRKRGGATAAKGRGGKKAKTEAVPQDEEAGPSTVSDAVKALKTASKGKKRKAKVDTQCSLQNAEVLYTVKPAIKTTCLQSPYFTGSLGNTFHDTELPYKDHLCIRTTFC